MVTKRNRIKVALTDEGLEKLHVLMEKEQQSSSKKVYLAQVIERLVENEYIIQKAFNHC